MPLKDLLVCFDRTAAGYARLELAFNLARASRAYLAGAYVLPETHASPAGSVGFGFAAPAGMTDPGEEAVSPGGVFREAEAAESAEQPGLFVPYAGFFETLGKRILSAWDGTREANRALHGALPLFTDPEATVV